MSARIVVGLSARYAHLSLVRGGTLVRFERYDHDDRALTALAGWLARHPKVPVYVMLDTAEEEYRAESLPHVRGRARDEMVRRKLMQFFRTAPYRASWLVGRSFERRREDLYVFAALASADLLRPTLEIIQTRQAPLAGIFLLASATEAFVQRLQPPAPYALVVTHQRAGLRQSFFIDGHLRLSRLIPVDALSEAAPAHLAVEEIEKSRQFLHNARILPRDAALVVRLLDADGALAQVPALLPRDAGYTCERLDTDALCKRTGVQAHALPADGDAMHAFWLARFRPERNLAESRLTRRYTSFRLRQAMFAASMVVLLTGGAWGGYNLYQSAEQRAAAAQTGAEIQRFRALYAEAVRAFPSAPASADQMRQVVEAAAALRQRTRSPQPFLIAVSQTLDRFAQIQLNEIVWEQPLPEHADRAPGTTGTQQGEIRAEIRPFDGDYRSALAQIEQFAAALRATPGMTRVSITKLPLDLDPTVALSGSTRDAGAGNATGAQFTLRLTWNPAS